jgi:hypothetical protein
MNRRRVRLFGTLPHANSFADLQHVRPRHIVPKVPGDVDRREAYLLRSAHRFSFLL